MTRPRKPASPFRYFDSSPGVIRGPRSYRTAMKELGNADIQEIGRWADNRVENGHLPFRRRERAVLRFRQIKTL